MSEKYGPTNEDYENLEDDEANNEWNSAIIRVAELLVEDTERRHKEGMCVGDTKSERIAWIIDQLFNFNIMDEVDDILRIMHDEETKKESK